MPEENKTPPQRLVTGFFVLTADVPNTDANLSVAKANNSYEQIAFLKAWPKGMRVFVKQCTQGNSGLLFQDDSAHILVDNEDAEQFSGTIWTGRIIPHLTAAPNTVGSILLERGRLRADVVLAVLNRSGILSIEDIDAIATMLNSDTDDTRTNELIEQHWLSPDD